MIFNSKNQVDNMRVFLQSKYVTWILKKTYFNRTMDNTQLEFIPAFDPNTNVKTDQDIYNLYNLSKDEIDIIEKGYKEG